MEDSDKGLLWELWAKTDPFRSLPDHLIDVGRTVQSLVASPAFAAAADRYRAATCCPREELTNWLGFIAALHDIGKCHPVFQGKADLPVTHRLEEEGRLMQSPVRFRHEGFSHRWVLDYLIDTCGWGKKAARAVAAALRGHHGDFSAEAGSEETTGLKEFWEPLRQELVAVLRQEFSPGDWRPRDFPDQGTAGVILAGLVVLGDWIASNRELLTGQDGSDREAPARAVDRLGFNSRIDWPERSSFQAVWPEFRQLRPLQESCEELVQAGIRPGLVIIEAPMGEGKTEAAAYLAVQWLAGSGYAGIYFALPTAAASNQMHGRMQAFLSAREPSTQVRLVHGMAWLMDSRTPLTAPDLDGDTADAVAALEWFRPKKRSLLAPYGVGTVDQVMLAALNVRHGFLRLLGLAGKVLIIDEVHAYDAYMSRIIHRLLAWCGVLEVPVILLSATLPARRRRELLAAYHPTGPTEGSPSQAYPLITVSEAGTVREIPVRAEKSSVVRLVRHAGLLGDAAKTAWLAQECTASGGCIVVIANTVGSAQNIYRSLKATIPEGTILHLFHSRFRAWERQAIEQEVLSHFDKRSLLEHQNPERRERPARAILVATQVVEQSLDIDFDVMISEIAPVDLILQRAGRLHRHRRDHRPGGSEAVLHLLLPVDGDKPDFGGTEHVYERYVLLRTLSALATLGQISLPEDLRGLVEAVYNETGPIEGEGEDIRLSYTRLQRLWQEEANLAGRCLIPQPNPREFDLSHLSSTFTDNEGEPADFFNARTRLGDDTLSVLAVDESRWRGCLSATRAPDRETLRKLCLQAVGLPRWWLADLEPGPGYAPIESSPAWLAGYRVLYLKDLDWRGYTARGKAVILRADPELGLVREE